MKVTKEMFKREKDFKKYKNVLGYKKLRLGNLLYRKPNKKELWGVIFLTYDNEMKLVKAHELNYNELPEVIHPVTSQMLQLYAK